MARMKAVQVTKSKGPFEIVERDIPEPGTGEVRIKVEACGVCHSDVITKEGLWPGMTYPRIPGHEVAGRIDVVGANVKNWKVGQRAGVGWHGGHCFVCEPCRRGDFIVCNFEKVCGISYDGGYAEYIVVPQEAVVSIPEGISAEEAAPLLCAGVTTFNSLRNSGARGGDLVAVQGLGGLGHLGVQFARKMGFHTVAIGRGKDKIPLAKQLGAHEFIDYGETDPAQELMKMGGAKAILATAPDANAMSQLVDGLSKNGRLMVVGAPAESLSISALALILPKRSIQGWPSGTAPDSEDTLRFSVRDGVRPMIERYPLEKAAEAYDRMMSGQARFRVVLTVGSSN